jgi:hypothetical protein
MFYFKIYRNSSCLVIDLGELKIQSKPRMKNSKVVDKALAKIHQHDTDYMEAMNKAAYDALLIELKDFQVCNYIHNILLCLSSIIKLINKYYCM